MAQVAVDTQTAVQPLLASDRCDRCSARALVRASLASGDLLFCGHHAKASGSGLVKVAVGIYDPSGVLSSVSGSGVSSGEGADSWD